MATEDTNGYVDGEYRSLLPDHLGPWTFDQSIRYEVAEDVLGDMIGYYTYRIDRERHSANPDPGAIAHWNQEQDRFARERRELPWLTDDERRAVIEHYGPMIRTHSVEIRADLEASGEFDELSQP